MKKLHEKIGLREHGIAQGEKGHETTAKGILHSKGRMSPHHHAIGEDTAINMAMGIHMDTSTLKKIFFQCLFLRERERKRACMSGGRGRERGRHRIQSRLQAPSGQHRA